jgi:RNA-binding protein 25
MIDRKLEPLVKRLMENFLGELEDDDLVMFVLEHLKDHKGPQKLVEGLEPVRPLSNFCLHDVCVVGK